MFRTTLLLTALCALAACDTPTRTSAPDPYVTTTTAQPEHQNIRGVLRRVVEDSIPTGWALEAGGGEMYKLLGGPVEMYDAFVDREVLIVGVIQSGTIMVDSLSEDSRLIPDPNRRPGGGE